MTTKIYGTSDDLIEVEGDVDGEVGCYGAQEPESDGVLLVCSDGTVMAVKYGKGGMGIWGITLITAGELFIGIDVCTDEDANPYSDVATFSDGMKWVIRAMDWKRVK
jgi:hypothetical protein